MLTRLAVVAALICSASPAISQSKTISAGDMLGACIGDDTKDSNWFRGKAVLATRLKADSYSVADNRIWLSFESPRHGVKIFVRVDNPKTIPRGFRKGTIVSVRGFVEGFEKNPPIDGACVVFLRDGATIQLDGF